MTTIGIQSAAYFDKLIINFLSGFHFVVGKSGGKKKKTTSNHFFKFGNGRRIKLPKIF